jgi:hypothetical protein
MGILSRSFLATVLLVLAVIVVPRPLADDSAPVPSIIRFSGTLHKATREPLTGTVGVTFLIYKDEQNGTPLWIETQNVVADAQGHYSVILGSQHTHGLPPELFGNGEARWLAVVPDTEPELPRVRLVAVPYALKAADAETLGGHPASAFLLAPGSQQLDGPSVVPAASAGTAVLGITDTGTPNTLAKFVTSTTLGSSLLTDNGTALGIRLTNPEQALDVLGRAQYRTEGYNTAGFFLRGTDTGPLVFVGQSGSNSSDPFAIWHSGAWRLTIDNAGRVGVGTSPEYRFDVGGRMRIRAEGNDSAGLFLGPSNDYPTVFVGQSGTNKFDPFAIWHSGGWRLAVTSSGNVGIGTTSPGDRLEVAGNIRLSAGGALTFSDGTSLNTAVVTISHLAANSVTTSAIADGAITGTKIAAGAISPSAITGTAATLGSNTFIGDQTLRGGIFARNYATTGTSQAIQGRTDSTAGIAIQAITSTTTGNTVALHGSNASNSGTAVLAEATSLTGTTIGLKSTTAGGGGSAAIFATASATYATDPTYGVRAESASQYGIGVLAYASSLNGLTKGVSAKVESASGVAGEFTNFAAGAILAGYNSGNRVFRLDSTGDLWLDGILHTSGGADFAEMVAVPGTRADYEPGDVLVIAPGSDRTFVLSVEPYSSTVAGVFSTKPGLLGSQHSQNTTQPTNEIPLAVIGIVPCKASTENGSIRRGDLLVTSSVPGHVMKATDRSRMVGAIVGKALSPLDFGSGTIEILVTLQ